MYIARIIYPVEVLGPGKRIGIWFAGCPRRCKGCSNPELWKMDSKYQISFKHFKELVLEIVSQKKVEGFTLTGGDPLFQPEAFRNIIDFLKTINDDILVYTGYSFKEIDRNLLKDVAVLIDGPYLESLNDNVFLRGSSNQTIYILENQVEDKYRTYISEGRNKIQNIVVEDGIISIGIHDKNFRM